MCRKLCVLILAITTGLLAYPQQYEESLQKVYPIARNGYFTIAEDIQQPCTMAMNGKVLSKSGDTLEFRWGSVYADSLHYKIIKVSSEATDFDDRTAGESIRLKLTIDSVVISGIDLSLYGDSNGIYLDSLMRSPDYANFGQRLHASLGFGVNSTVKTEVWMELTKNVLSYNADNPAPTIRNYRYGPYWSRFNVLDFWRSETSDPAPVYFFIHGGGWSALDKKGIGGNARTYRNLGFACVSISYRYAGQGGKDGATPPSMYPLYDGVRAMQTVRSKAAEWNIDPDRIVTDGGSAGGCTSMWLALHDDLADPSSTDPIARYSSKPTIAMGVNAQTSLNPYDFITWPYIGTTNAIFTSGMPPSAYGISTRNKTWEQVKEELLAVSRDILDEYSPLTHVSDNDVPVYLYYADGLVDCTPDSCDGGAIHHAQMGAALKQKMDSAGVECILRIPGESYADPYGSQREFAVQKLIRSTAARTGTPGLAHNPARMVLSVMRTSRGYLVRVPANSRAVISDARGRRIATFTRGGVYALPAAAHGVYCYSIRSGETVSHGRVVLSGAVAVGDGGTVR